jgi:hypothetical protein
MSKEAMETIVGKAVLDTEFREALFANPDEVLAGYDLSEEEVGALKALDAEHISKVTPALGPAAAEYKSPHDRGFELFSGLGPDEQ